jgi:peptide/nickel transport system permease protein
MNWLTDKAKALRYMVGSWLGARKGDWTAQWKDAKYTLHLLRKNPLVVIGSAIAIFFIIVALLANVIVDPNIASDLEHYDRKYMWSNRALNWGLGTAIYSGPEYFFLGTDGYGRDLLKMIILALPLDMENAFIITVSAAAIGITIGALAGYIGGVIDEAVLRITDIFFAFPGLILALVFAALLGRSVPTLRLAILLVWWPTYVRLTRGQVLAEKEKNYVEALRALGVGRLRILFRHILPNSIYPLIVQATLDFGGVILTFSALMFLGFSPSPILPELGNLASDGYLHIFDAPWLLVFPGLTILVIALAFNLVGDGLRDVLDPRLRR